MTVDFCTRLRVKDAGVDDDKQQKSGRVQNAHRDVDPIDDDRVTEDDELGRQKRHVAVDAPTDVIRYGVFMLLFL